MSYALLSSYSYYSMGYGASSVSALVAEAALKGVSILALTDVETLAGQIQFHHLCRERSIKPITGVELREGTSLNAPAERIVLLAQNRQGYENLCRVITSRRSVAKTEAPPSIHALIAEHSDGVYILCEDTSMCAKLMQAEVPADSLRLCLSRPSRDCAKEAAVIAFSRKHLVPIVADSRTLYYEPLGFETHLLLSAIATKKPYSKSLAQLERQIGILRNATEFRALYSEKPDLIDATNELAERCSHFDLRYHPPILPNMNPSGITADEELERRCRLRGGYLREDYENRLKFELETIKRVNMANYFLLVSDIVQECTLRKIRVIARGKSRTRENKIVAQIDDFNADKISHSAGSI